jgi:DNA topoisomerase-6 subunit B
MVSVWVPFTSESKEAIADYDEIRKEMKLALQECGRKLGTYLRRRKRMARESERRSAFERYIGEISRCCNALTGTNTDKLYKALMKQAKRRTEEADSRLDDEGQVIDDGGRLKKDDDVIIVDEMKDLHKVGDSLFVNDKPKKKRTTSKKKKTRRKRRKN